MEAALFLHVTSGRPTDDGRGSVQAYLWPLECCFHRLSTHIIMRSFPPHSSKWVLDILCFIFVQLSNVSQWLPAGEAELFLPRCHAGTVHRGSNGFRPRVPAGDGQPCSTTHTPCVGGPRSKTIKPWLVELVQTGWIPAGGGATIEVPIRLTQKWPEMEARRSACFCRFYLPLS